LDEGTEWLDLGHFCRFEVMCRMAGLAKSRRPALRRLANRERQGLAGCGQAAFVSDPSKANNQSPILSM
jgi:hypothetical protein